MMRVKGLYQSLIAISIGIEIEVIFGIKCSKDEFLKNCPGKVKNAF
jgi:hypothetical protein